jgi:hypothetical protein
MKEGENIRDLKCLQVDLSLKSVLRGRRDIIFSSIPSGNRLHISGSIAGLVIASVCVSQRSWVSCSSEIANKGLEFS